MISDMTSMVRSFAGQRVLVIGDLILDCYAYGDATRISPEAPVPVLRSVERDERVGGSANVAACLVALGAEVRCVGTVGADAAGQRLRSLLSDIGIDDAGLIVADDRCTSMKTGCVFGGQFLGCSSDFVAAVLQSFTPAFGESLGTGLGAAVGGLLDLGALLGG